MQVIGENKTLPPKLFTAEVAKEKDQGLPLVNTDDTDSGEKKNDSYTHDS